MGVREEWQRPGSPGLRSLNQLLAWIRAEGEAPRLCAKRGGQWVALSAAAFYRNAQQVAAALTARGIRPGDRVGLLAESRPEWLIADFGCLAAGAVDVPIYPTLTPEQSAYILHNSGARGVFVSTAAQAAKVASMRDRLPELEWVCCFEAAEWADMLAEPVRESDAEFRERLEATAPGAAATLLYTSGTTGVPKGLLLTHENLCANLNVSSLDFEFGPNERRLSILPLSHITERHIAYIDMLYGAATYFAESMETVVENLREVRPTVLVSVPRLYEKVAAGVRAQAEAKSRLERAIFDWACRVGQRLGPYRQSGQRATGGLRLQAAVADRLVWSKLRGKLGGCLNKVISGGAPLGKGLGEFLLSLGIVVDEGYGLSETSPIIALNRPGGRRLGSVGRPLPNVDVRFAADGELLVRGPSVFAGYYGLPEQTAAALRDGWFHTGDMGYQDADGFIFITDRKKDLIKTSGGKFIAPQPIEARLKMSPLIAEAVVVGDGRNFASVLLVPDWAVLQQAGVACVDRVAACQDEAVRQRFAAEVERVNAELARFETLKKFALLAEPFTVESGELTPTIKVRRRAVEAHYREVIEAFYAGGARAEPRS